ncbi:MAG: flagellar basal body-associated FliL family protein [Rhodobacteraceae bacterium]|nr:flagellar basal body-associated FliL family protein [Paracoccaceae bacterium]
MSDAVAEPKEEPVKSGKMPLIIGMVLALAGGGGGFYAATSGMIPFGKTALEGAQMDGDSNVEIVTGDSTDGLDQMPVPIGDIAYVEVDPITISLNGSQSARHLRFRAQLEVNADYEEDVMAIIPRVTDVMNSYLRALELHDLTGPLALTRLRAQMLRRVQVVTGNGRVRDLLIMEFVLN